MPTTYRIHPGIGIARLGNSPDAFCISPEKPAALPLDCDGRGNPLLTPDGMTEKTIAAFKAGAPVSVSDAPRIKPRWIGNPFSNQENSGSSVGCSRSFERSATRGANKNPNWRFARDQLNPVRCRAIK